MSEQSSLYAKIKIKKENYEAFLKSKLAVTKDQTGWGDWWNGLEMYGEPNIEDNLVTYHDENIAAFIQSWLEMEDTLPFSDYDAETETWHFGLVMFTDNYAEMIPCLGALRGVSEFKEADESDFVIIFPYFWESSNNCNAYLKFTAEGSVFVKEVTEVDITEARAYLDKKWGEFAARQA